VKEVRKRSQALAEPKGEIPDRAGRRFNKKAQITVFMIVGIILLFSSALLFYIRSELAGVSGEFIPVAEEVPLEAQPIKVFVEDCLEKVATEGIVKMGAHGGYVDPGDASYGSVFSVGIEPTESEALVMVEGSSAMVPYWWFLKSPNDCIENCRFESNRPALYKTQTAEKSIEGQLDTYIKRNLPSCLEDFRAFREQGFQIEYLGEIEPDFKVAEKESLILMKYPLRISREGRAAEISQFYTKLDINLKEIYDLATRMLNSEIELSYIEKHTMNLIAMYSKPVGTDRLPPLGHFSFFDYGQYLIWTTTETRDRLSAYVLPAGVSMFQLVGSSNYHRNVIFDMEKQKYDRIMTGMMDKTMVMLNETNFDSALEARFMYSDWWPFYLNINDAEVLKPTEVESLIAGPMMNLIGIKQYRFYYDISFPVLVMISDPTAFKGKGYKFSFAFEANIRDNSPMNSSFMGLPTAPSASYFCDINQRNSGKIRVEVEDMFTGEPVEHARVDFSAGDELCFLGYAELDETNRSVFEANFPIGMGEIRVRKEGYSALTQPFTTFLDEPGNYTLKLSAFYFINATVKPIPLEYRGQGKYGAPGGAVTASLMPYQKVIMTLKRVDDDGFGEYEAYVVYNVSEGPSEVMIVPGKYEVEGFLMNYQGHKIGKESKIIEMIFSDDVKLEFNESVFNPWSEGGVELNDVSGYVDLPRDKLMNSRGLIFKILRFPKPSTHSRDVGSGPDLGQMSEYGLYSNIYRHELQPEWVN
jgi:hypothetical protein